MNLIFLGILTAFVFTGCTTVQPAVHEYAILPTYMPVNHLAQPINATLKISTTRSIPSLASTQFYYLKSSTDIAAYAYSRWSDTPANMIARVLSSSLDNEHLFTAIVSPASSATADLLLESDLNGFYHRFIDNAHSEGYIDVTYRLVDPKTKKTIASKRFVITQPSPSQNANGGVLALNLATQELSHQCIAWLGMNLKENRWTK